MLGWLIGRLAEKSEQITGTEYTTPRVQKTGGIAPAFSNLEDPAVLRRHSLRALCGALMDRHSDCQRAHPFCGPGHQQNGDTPRQFVAMAVQQRSGNTGAALIGVYLCPSTDSDPGNGQQEVMDYLIRMVPTQAAPTHKLVVAARGASDVYPTLIGKVKDATGDENPGGMLDSGTHRTVRCTPTPGHCKWQYWDSEIELRPGMVPRFHCLQVFGQWWIAEVDQESGMAQQVAALDFADNPGHNR